MEQPRFLPGLDAALLILFFTVLILLLIRHHLSTQTLSSRNYRPCSYPILGNLPGLLVNHHRFLDWATDLLRSSPTGTIQIDLPFGLDHGICTTDPSSIDHLLRVNFRNYVKGTRQQTVLSDLLGERGLFVSDGPIWAIQRKLASHAFSVRSLRWFLDDVVTSKVESRLLPRLSVAAAAGEVVDLQDVLSRFSLDCISRFAFGSDPACLDPDKKPERFATAFDEAIRICYGRFFAPVPWVWRLKRVLNVGTERRLRESVKVIDEYAAGIIAARKGQSRLSNPDLLSWFEEADIGGDEDDKRKFLRDVVVSFVLAGKDSISTALTWFFWLLTQNPNCRLKIREELNQQGLTEDNRKPPRYDDLKRLHYTHAAISESLRLHPPVPINSRVATSDDVLPDGTRVEAGWFADYSAYAMARSERVWGEDCGEFRPERWLDDGRRFVQAEPAKFAAFHAGPRACLGREMAYMQMKCVVAAVVGRFDVEVVEEGWSPAGIEMGPTWKMKGGFPVRVTVKTGGE